MLPGLRFLFAAIVLSISLLIFGLGAAALLRAAHQEFASLPSRPAPPEPVFASQTEALPTLAMMRVDAMPADEAAPERPAAETVQAAARPESSSSIVASTPQAPAAEPDSAALPMVLTPEAQQAAEIAPSETLARNEPPASETPPASQAPPPAEAPFSIETKLATNETAIPTSANQATPADTEQTSAVTPTADAVSAKIATLGGPPVEIEPQASPIKATSKSRDSAKKRLRSERAAQRRKKMARRATALRRASQAPADPFGAQPFGGFPGASRNQ